VIKLISFLLLAAVLSFAYSADTVFVSDILTWPLQSPNTNGWGMPEKDSANGEQAAHDGNPLMINHISYKKGIGAAPYGKIIVPLNGKYTRFLTDVGLDNETQLHPTWEQHADGTNLGHVGWGVFKVYVDGIVRATSPTCSTILIGTPPSLSVDVTGAGAMWLECAFAPPPHDNGVNAHMSWCNARLVRDPSVTAVKTCAMQSNKKFPGVKAMGPNVFVVTGAAHAQITLANISGRTLLQTNGQSRIDCSRFVKSVYFVNIVAPDSRSITQMIVIK
jgi:hypothetical protein